VDIASRHLARRQAEPFSDIPEVLKWRRMMSSRFRDSYLPV